MAILNTEDSERFSELIRQREFTELISILEEGLQREDFFDPIDYLGDVIKDASDENIYAFFEYLEQNSEYNPVNSQENRLSSDNYNKEYFNPAYLFGCLVILQKFTVCDQILAKEGYFFTQNDLNMYRFMIQEYCGETEEHFITEAKNISMWFVTRGNLTWNDIPPQFRPN